MLDKKKWFCKKIRELEDGLFRVSYSILKNTEDSQDVVQEAICKAYTNLNNLRDENKFKAWIYAIVHNTSLEILKKKKYHVELEEEILTTEKSDIEDNLSLWHCIEKLNEPYRTVIVLYYYEDLSIKEISSITGANIDAVKKQLSRGREKIKEDMNI